MHANSMLAFEAERIALNERESMIVAFLKATPQPLTDRDIMARLGFNDPNSVRPRITTLIDKGYLVEAGDVKCEVTGRTVRTVKAI